MIKRLAEIVGSFTVLGAAVWGFLAWAGATPVLKKDCS